MKCKLFPVLHFQFIAVSWSVHLQWDSDWLGDIQTAVEFLFWDDLPNPLSLNHTYLLTSLHPTATAVSSPHSLKSPEASSIAISALTCLRPRGLRYDSGPSLAVCTCQVRTMNLCNPVLKVMYSCDSVDNFENKYWRYIVLHCQPRLLLYMLLGGRGLRDNSPECTLRDSPFVGF